MKITKRKVLVLTIAGVLVTSVACFGIVLLNGSRWLYLMLLLLVGVLCYSLLRYGTLVKTIVSIVLSKIKVRLGKSASHDPIYPIMTEDEKTKISEAVKVSFAGDLILLRDAVEKAYDPKSRSHDFSHMFEYVADIWKSSDLSIGVFEGPMGGAEKGWSTSDYDDGIPLALNFPDSFGRAVKDAGMNLVTLANNHILDVGLDAALRTMDVLDSIDLDYVGAYRNQQEYETIKIVNLKGKKVAVLAYTYALNGTSESFLFEGNHKYITRPLVGPRSKYFKQNLKIVESDFAKAKAAGVDAIFVLPHIGEQFNHYPDKNQRQWCDIFVKLGADIIFSDHTHSVQPLEWRKNEDGKNVLIVYCPGNFVNSYTSHDGDASMIVNAYLDPDTFEPIAASVIPIYAYCKQAGSWTGLPIHKALSDCSISKDFSRADYQRIERVHSIVTGVALGAPLKIDNLQDEYYSIPHLGYKRGDVQGLDIEQFKSGGVIKLIHSAKNICFVGDSVTEGTKNGGYGWHEPLIGAFPDKNYTRFAKGSMTSKYFREHSSEIAAINADLYVVAFGCNDIRYRDPVRCAMTADEYINNISQLYSAIINVNPDANFIFIAPWMSLYFDANYKGKHEVKIRLYTEYSSALKDFCESHQAHYVDPNPLIFDNICSPDIAVKGYSNKDVLVDFIHPNASLGIQIYSRAVARL